jgi:lipoyl(octanoyl) transferase
VTSLADLGQLIAMHEVDVALKAAFEKVFGAVERVDPPLRKWTELES